MKTSLFKILCSKVVGLLLLLGSARGQEGGAPVPPEELSGIEVDPGFFPTFQDGVVLSGAGGGNPDYMRSAGGALNPADLGRITAATDGPWAYKTQPTPMSRLQRMLVPFDYVLQPLVSGWGFNLGQSETGFSSADIGGRFPGFTRSYSPEESHLAYLWQNAVDYSPFFFDVLNVSALAAYGHGTRASPTGDGLIAGLSTDIRGVLRLTDKTSFMVNGRLYLTWDEQSGSDSGFGLYFTSGQPAAFATFLHQFEVGEWDVTLFDYVGALSGWEMFRSQTYEGAYAQTIGASIGIQEYRADRGDWFDTNSAWLYNHAGIRAGAFLNRDLRLILGLTRRDSWSFDGFDRRQGTELFDAGLYYNNNAWWIAPSVTWTSYSQDFEFIQHAMWLNGTAPLSPNITANAGIGYTFGSDVGNRMLWRVGASWQMTRRLTSRFDYTQGYFSPDIGDSWLGTMLGYRINWNLGARLDLGYAASWMDSNLTDNSVFSQGINASYALGNYSSLRASLGRQDRSGGSEGNTMIYSIELSSRLAARLYGVLGYRNSNFQADGNDIADGNWGTAYFRLTRTF